MVAKGTGDRGGVGRYLRTLLEAWPSDNAYSLHVVDPYGPIGLAGSPAFLLLAGARLITGAAAGRIDVLHIHACSRGSFLRKGLLTRLAALLRLPVILHLHAPDFETFHDSLPAAGRRFVATTFSRADRVVVLGRYWRDIVTRRIGVAPERVTTILSATRAPDGVRVERRDPPQIVFVGQLGERKGIADLLQALAAPDVVALPWTLRVLGDGDVARWRSTAAQLGLANRIEFEGWVSEDRVRHVLAESSVFVLPSRAEGLSIALLEAMAFGLAIVTTAVGGAADTLVHETSALLIPPSDPVALSGALVRVVGDAALRVRLQQAAQERFALAHDITDYCRALTGLYDEVLLERANTRP